jgi:hypothetical protein
MISAKIVKDSVSSNGKRLTTFELEYPRFIHSELLTHRMLSRNAASSRAIPVATMLKMIWNNPAEPVHWGANQSGMQAKNELVGYKLKITKALWSLSGKVACGFAYLMSKAGCHKQIVNRIVEPWSHIKVVTSATDWDNFFHLRNHPDAQPEIHELARIMWDLYNNSIPKLLKTGEWHLPYLDDYNIFPDNEFVPFRENDICLSDAIKLSASLCAQTSYRKSDESIKKALGIYDRLVTSIPVHASPFEHQATPAKTNIVISGNFRGWTQYRQIIPNNVCKKYSPLK